MACPTHVILAPRVKSGSGRPGAFVENRAKPGKPGKPGKFQDRVLRIGDSLAKIALFFDFVAKSDRPRYTDKVRIPTVATKIGFPGARSQPRIGANIEKVDKNRSFFGGALF